MLVPVQFTENSEFWLKIFPQVMAEDPEIILHRDTLLITEGSDNSFYPEVRIMGAFKSYDSFVVITFKADASWDTVSDLKFESAPEISGLQLLSEEERELVDFHNVTIYDVEGGETRGDEWESSQYEGQP